MYYHNLETCIGCGACQIACKDHNDLTPGTFFRRVDEVTLPDGTKRFMSRACNHCKKPACLAACPNGAFYQTEDGFVLHDDGKCIGCGRCVWACPYGAVSLNPEKGVAQKCLGCVDYRRRGEEPPCVAACVNRSLQIRGGGQGWKGTIKGVLPPDSITHPQAQVRLSGGGGDK